MAGVMYVEGCWLCRPLSALRCPQVDVEGCEMDVLLGMDASAWAITRHVVAEVSVRCAVFAHLCLHALHTSALPVAAMIAMVN